MRGERERGVPGEGGANRLVVWVVSLSTLFSSMGASGVNLALPDLGKELSIGIDSSSWVVLSFLVVTSAFMLVAGRLGDVLGMRRVFLAGHVLIALGTAACGAAPVFEVLVAARALHGLGAAMVMAISPALLTLSSPPEQRGRVLGLVSTATYVGLSVGPLLGGLIVSHLGWRWVFFLNTLVALAVMTMSLRWLPRMPAAGGRRLDLGGAALLIIAFLLLLIPIGAGAKRGWDLPMAACAAAGVAVLAAFTAVERRVKAPLLDLAIFRSRVFTGSVLAALTLYVTLFTVVLLLPFYFVEGRGLEPSQAGALLCAQPVGMALVSAPAGNLSDRLGTRLFCVTGAGIVGVGVLLLSWAGPATPLVWTVLGLAVIGIGTGVFTSPNSSAMMGAAPRGGQGVAGGVLAVSRNLGMMLGTAMAAGLYVAAGGATGRHWQAEDYSAFHITGLAALLPCLLAMLSSTLKGNAEKKGSA